MNNEVVLVNYRVPVPLKAQFEAACRQLNMPMTTQINILMREFVHRQKRAQQDPDKDYEPISFYGMDDPL